jgi:hypothetical protein
MERATFINLIVSAVVISLSFDFTGASSAFSAAGDACSPVACFAAGWTVRQSFSVALVYSFATD